MIETLIKTPIDYLSWGNHETDIDHEIVCKHVERFHNSGGVWINSNMQNHEAMKFQKPFEVIEIKSEDGSCIKRVGLIAVLSNDPKLYINSKNPFGGATIEDPWETLKKYNKILKRDYHCDLVIPLEHLYVPENEKTCNNFHFPVILSGHDHHQVDKIINGTRLIKPGMNGDYATILEIVYHKDSLIPEIRSQFVKTSDFDPDHELKEFTKSAYDVLIPLRHTELIKVPDRFDPLSSKNARETLTSMGQFICTVLKLSLNERGQKIDGVILMGGNIRGRESYPKDSFFSLEMLEAEINSGEVIGIVEIPGFILKRGIEVTHEGGPKPGWMQYDEGIRKQDLEISFISFEMIDLNRHYRIATKISDLTNGQSPPLAEYFTKNSHLLPSRNELINIQAELMDFLHEIHFGIYGMPWEKRLNQN
jgi:hypothetical protein